MAASVPTRRARIPRSFTIMGHTIEVRRIPRARWKAGKDCLGFFDPANMVIAVCSTACVTTQEHTFWHEVTHAIYYCLGSPEYANEEHVDQVGGLLHQIVSSME